MGKATTRSTSARENRSDLPPMIPEGLAESSAYEQQEGHRLGKEPAHEELPTQQFVSMQHFQEMRQDFTSQIDELTTLIRQGVLQRQDLPGVAQRTSSIRTAERRARRSRAKAARREAASARQASPSDRQGLPRPSIRERLGPQPSVTSRTSAFKRLGSQARSSTSHGSDSSDLAWSMSASVTPSSCQPESAMPKVLREASKARDLSARKASPSDRQGSPRPDVRERLGPQPSVTSRTSAFKRLGSQARHPASQGGDFFDPTWSPLASTELSSCL